MTVVQEFYCNSYEGCGGYFRVCLNMALTCNVKVTCPKCGHVHERAIQDGEIKGVHLPNKTTEEIVVPIASWSQTPKLKMSRAGMRDAVVLRDTSRDFVKESWNERYGDRV